MSLHSAFLLGRALAAIRITDPATYDRLLADVNAVDLPAVRRGMEDAARGERATDMAIFIEGVRA